MFLNIEKKVNIHLISILFTLFFIFNFYIHFPGEMTPDSSNQLAEALTGNFSDLHPPVMAFLWSYLIRIADATPAMLAFHLVFHWLGLYFISAGLLKIGKKRLALLVLISGFFPVLFFHNGFLHKDIGMASTFVTAFGLAFYFKIQEKKIPNSILLACVILLVYGTLVRANAIFAVGPLVIYMFLNSNFRESVKKIFVFSILISIVALPLSQLMNKQVIGARALESTYPLFLFDIVGIAKQSNDLQVLPNSIHISKEDINKCFTPFWWDPLSPWGACSQKTEIFGKENNVSSEELGRRKELKDVWVKAITLHPLSYIEHRLKVLNSELYFLVPAYHCHYAVGCGTGQNIARNIKLDYIKNNFLFWPVSWLSLGCVLFAIQTKTLNDKQADASKMLVLSGIFYLLTLFVVGIATVNRYAYWPILATLLGLILGFDQVKENCKNDRKLLMIGVGLMLFIIVLGLSARVFNFTYFVK